MTEYRKFDSSAKYIIHNARLAKDAEVKETEKGKLVRLTFVDTSRNDADSDMWIEATVQDRNADFAAFLKKGDTLGVEGKLCLRRYGDNNEKFAHNLRFAEIFPPIGLHVEVKERGFTPGAGKPATKGKTAPKGKPAPAKRAPVDLDDDDDLVDGEEN